MSHATPSLLLVLALAGPLVSQPDAWRLERAWTSPLATARGTSIVALHVVGDHVLVEDALHGVTALDAATGLPRWIVQLDAALTTAPGEGDGVVTLTSGTHVTVVDALAGRRVRTIDVLGVPDVASVATGDVLLVPTIQDDELRAFAVRSGLERWSMRLPGALLGPARLIGGGDARAVLLATRDGSLRALPATLEAPARERWTVRTGRLAAPPIVADGRVVVVSRHDVRMLDANSGERLWAFSPGSLASETVAVTEAHVVVAAGGRLHGVARAGGAVAWGRDDDALPVLGFGAFALVRRDDVLAVLDERGRDVITGLADGPRHAAGALLVSLQDGRVVAERVVPR